MADEHLQKALADLIDQRERKAAEFNAELARLDNAIEAVRTLVQPDGQPGPGGISIQSVDSLKMQDGASVAVARAVQPGDFFAMSQADAAREYLKRLGRAATLDDIFSALQRGGVRFQGKDPTKNLYISLTLMKTLFVLVAPPTF